MTASDGLEVLVAGGRKSSERGSGPESTHIRSVVLNLALKSRRLCTSLSLVQWRWNMLTP